MRAGINGRPHTTGKYPTRQELVNAVWYYSTYTYLETKDVAWYCRVSVGVALKILREELPEAWVHVLGSEHALQTALADY